MQIDSCTYSEKGKKNIFSPDIWLKIEVTITEFQKPIRVVLMCGWYCFSLWSPPMLAVIPTKRWPPSTLDKPLRTPTEVPRLPRGTGFICSCKFCKAMRFQELQIML